MGSRISKGFRVKKITEISPKYLGPEGTPAFINSYNYWYWNYHIPRILEAGNKLQF